MNTIEAKNTAFVDTLTSIAMRYLKTYKILDMVRDTIACAQDKRVEKSENSAVLKYEAELNTYPNVDGVIDKTQKGHDVVVTYLPRETEFHVVVSATNNEGVEYQYKMIVNQINETQLFYSKGDKVFKTDKSKDMESPLKVLIFKNMSKSLKNTLYEYNNSNNIPM